MASNPLFIILSYGYLRFEGNGKIPLRRWRKGGKGKGKD